MIKIGNWLDRCDERGMKEQEGYNSFIAMYMDVANPPVYLDWKHVVSEYELDNITEFKFGEGVQHIVVLECHDGSINQVLSLEEDERIKVYGGCNLGVFNTDGAAFIQCFRNDEEIAVFMIDNSPHDLGDDVDDWYNLTGGRADEDQYSREVALHEFRQHLIEHGVDIEQLRVTRENTIFVTQL